MLTGPLAKRQRSTSPAMSSALKLPSIPMPVKDFIPHFSKNKNTPVQELLEPYKAYEAELRKFYAQQPDDPVVKDGLVNTVPIFAGDAADLKVRARKLDSETEAEKEKYVIPLADADRRPDGSPAVVTSFKEFQTNFNLFSESSLTELDWSNVVAAGSSVTTALLPVPEKWAGSKKSLREYYHERLAPASDVDLFLYGLTEEEGLEKIKQIEAKIKDSILHEVTTIRTKNAITIASQYPTRHVQIVLRLYDSISQIITGFDVDCACAAYDGKQVYASPRALAAFATQTNTVDLTRRSPSYENRLSKYSHRGFEVHWPDLDRSRIDPTIFERAFQRTMGLARLLVLEKLPKSQDREQYTDKRRTERGRPAVNRYNQRQRKLHGNIKDDQEDDVAEWVEEDQVSDYHTMVVPYGKRFNARNIERLLYTKDLLLNSEWNRPKDREVNLHRHPCFFGTAADVLGDCCGFCPVPETEEEIEVAQEESRQYISGSLAFIKDDPGRQEIGSFNPITTDDWTEMAYVGNTQMLCQAIVDGDLDYIRSWCEQEGNDINTRDYVGRTPLHLAVVNGRTDAVKLLVDNGARLIARLLDGRAALHIAAQFGNNEIVKILMEKSLSNEEEEEAKADKLKAAKKPAKDAEADTQMEDVHASENDESESSGMEDSEEDNDADSETQGFTKVKPEKEQAKPEDSNDIPDDDAEEPDFYDINVVAWDLKCTPLHFAIMGGHIPMIHLLVEEYGADVLLPIKLVSADRYTGNKAILPLVLAMSSPPKKLMDVIKVLLKLGATSAQADMDHFTALHYMVEQNKLDLLDVLLKHDGPAAQSVLNQIYFGSDNIAQTALSLALQKSHEEMSSKLLTLGAKPCIGFDDYVKPFLAKVEHAKRWTAEANLKHFETNCLQPIIHAATHDLPNIVIKMLQGGAYPNTLTTTALTIVENPTYSQWRTGMSVLDIVRNKLKKLKEYVEGETPKKEPATMENEAYYLKGLKSGTYKHWTALNRYKSTKAENDVEWQVYRKEVIPEKGFEEAEEAKKAAVRSLVAEYEEAETILVGSGGKTFKELYPNIGGSTLQENHQSRFANRTASPYETYFTFNLPDLNDRQKEGYFRLFEAVWSNDIDEVKALTLGSWKSEDGEENLALKVAVQDTVPYIYTGMYGGMGPKMFVGVSPFSLAVIQGPSHYKMAKAIVEIALAQYEPEENAGKKSRWRIEFGEDSEYSDSDGEDVVQLHSELVDDVFTVDNVAAISNVIKSHIKPLDMLRWRSNVPSSTQDAYFAASSLVGYAVDTDDIGLLKFLYNVAEEQATHFPDDTVSPCWNITNDSFNHALNQGRTAILGEMIKKTGVGIPLDQLVEKSGVTIQDKPKHYQGLNVGGKKNADWAQAANPNGDYTQKTIEKTPPLLKAAQLGSLESVQWFISELPAIKLLEFAATNQNDKRVQVLSKSEGGFERAITKWLSMRNDLVLHCAILRNPTKVDPTKENPAEEKLQREYIALVNYIVTNDPSLLERRSLGGFTPLHVACTLHITDVIRLLLAAGADARRRDTTGRNMLHHLLVRDGKILQNLLSLFPKRDVAEMLLERDVLGNTPLAFWQSQCSNAFSNGISDAIAVPALLASYSSGKDLTVLNAAGDLPLHVAIKQGRPLHVRHFLERDAHTLGWENGTGITALELAFGMRQSAAVLEAGKGGANSHDRGEWQPGTVPDIMTKDRMHFVKKEGRTMEEKVWDGELDAMQKAEWVWEECLAAKARLEREEGGVKRRLVALSEANEVARHAVLAQKRASEAAVSNWRHPDSGRFGNNGAESGEEETAEGQEWDEVIESLGSLRGLGWIMGSKGKYYY